MKIPDEYIEEFQRIYLEEFGEQITRKEAYDKFLRLVNFMRVILYPIPEKEEEKCPRSSSQFDEQSRNDKLGNQP